MKGKMITLKADGTREIRELDRKASLEELQAAVGGYIERVPLFEHFGADACVAFGNENGKIEGLPVNPRATFAWFSEIGQPVDDILVGDVVVLQGDDEFMSAI